MKGKNPGTAQPENMPTVHYEFKIRKSEEYRKSNSQRALIENPEKVPVVVEEVCDQSALPPLAHRKLLVPRQLTAGQLMHLLRSRLRVPPAMPLFVVMGERAPSAGDLVGHLYDRLHDEDGFLYVAYSPQSGLSGPKCHMRAPPSPPPPPTTPTTSEEPDDDGLFRWRSDLDFPAVQKDAHERSPRRRRAKAGKNRQGDEKSGNETPGNESPGNESPGNEYDALADERAKQATLLPSILF